MAELLKQLEIELSVEISANSTGSLDKYPLSVMKCIEYSICISRTSSSGLKFLKMTAFQVDSGLKESVRGRGGDPINVEISTAIDGADFSLVLKNNENETLKILLTRKALS